MAVALLHFGGQQTPGSATASSGTGSGGPQHTGTIGGPVRTATIRTTPTTKTTVTTRTTPKRVHKRPPVAGNGPYAIGVREITFLEPATSTTANGTSGGAPVRTLQTSILYPASGRPFAGEHPGAAPAAGGPFPLIVFSQGFDQPVSAYTGLLDAWARAGFVVAAPTYPLTDSSSPEGIDESDILNHPADLRFVISSLVTDAQPGGQLAGLVDSSRIAVAGHSDGGDVSLAVAANNCCHDPAVRAAVIMSGAELPSFGGTYYAGGSVPLLVTQGSLDPTNAPGCSVALYDQAPPPKYYVTLLGADHLKPYIYATPYRDYVAAAVIAFLDRYLKGQGAGLGHLLGKGGVPGVASITTASQLAGQATSCP